MEKKKYILGSIAIILALSFVIISMPGIGVKMRVDEDKTTFYVKLLDDAGIPYGRYLVSGREYNRLFSGNTLQYRDKSTININTTIDNATNSTTIIRSTGYQNGAIIKDTYEFDGGTTDVELFPVSHKVEVINGSGLFYRYTVDELKDTGEKRKLIDEYEISFGMRMKVELDEGYNWAWIGWPYGSDSLSAQYKIETDYEVFNVRLFDPLISSNLLYDDFNDDSYNTTLWETLQIGSGGGGAVTEAGSEYLYLKAGSLNNADGNTLVGAKANITDAENFTIRTALKTDSYQTEYNANGICFYVDYPDNGASPYNGVCVLTNPGGSFPNEMRIYVYENGVTTWSNTSETTDTVPQSSYINRTIRVRKEGSNTTLNITNGATDHYYVLPGDYSGGYKKFYFSTNPISHGVYWDFMNITLSTSVDILPVAFFNVTLNPAASSLIYQPNWSLVNWSSVINISGNYSWNITEYNITAFNCTTYTFNVTNNESTTQGIYLKINDTKSWYNWKCYDQDVSTTFVFLFNLAGDTSQLVNCTLDLINAGQTYTDWVVTENNATWDFNYTFSK